MRKIIFLNESFDEYSTDEILVEGKLLNNVRWKLAKFSLRFLKESAINEFLMAYYKNGKEGKQWVAKSKKEKIKKIKDLAENLKPEEKEKVANSEAAKKMEKSAIKSGIFAGIAGLSAGISAIGNAHSSSESDYKYNKGIEHKDQALKHAEKLGVDKNTSGFKDIVGDFKNIKVNDAKVNGIKVNEIKVNEIEIVSGWPVDHAAEARYHRDLANDFLGTASLLSVLASICFGAMWGSLIVAGISGIRSGISAHKANTIRREEIMKELLNSKKNLKEDFEMLSIGIALNEAYI